MGYNDLQILRSYKTNKNDIVKEFYIPTLTTSVLYKRAVGFFSSTALIELSKGIAGLIKRRGKIKFIVSPLLSEDDIEAIKRGYDERKIIEQSLLREIYEPTNDSDKERLNWLSYLIANNYLEIKVAFTPPHKMTGIYHEKIGIIYDENQNRIAFTGSMNETINAFHNNYESIVVFNSLVKEDLQRVSDLENDFDSLWAGREENIKVIDFPQVVIEKLVSYRKDSIDLTLDEIELVTPEEKIIPGIPRVPQWLKFHEYQNNAIDAWEANHFIGIFDMATGTGKTFTGLGAVTRLFEKTGKLAVIVVCPYQHLVEQWVDDIIAFNMLPTIGYSASPQKDWKKRLDNDILDFSIGVIDCLCFVTTNATFSSDYIQTKLKGLGQDTVLIIDEAHNFGSERLRKTLNSRYQYRLALSATLERHGDKIGTQALYDFFEKKCIEYDLQRAIDENKLTPYYYHPIVVYFSDEELLKYRELSKKIAKCCHKNKFGELEITEQGKKLLLQRARIVAGAKQKVEVLKKLMLDHVSDSHILIYCGATRSDDFSKDASSQDEEGERQIVSISKMLGLELGMKVTHFTSAESARERELIKKQFANIDPYQALVAIKCLDEGVNIPGIKTAFILASSTNPKEYIQRRGRVLRLAENKPYAIIYDFITLPTPLEYVGGDEEVMRLDKSLIKREIVRMQEFGEISKNPSEANALVNELKEVYRLDLIKEEDEIYE